MISIVISTYNGEKYIREQLQSIFDQTLRADEVIIWDDGSNDSTVDICKSFIQEHHVDKWRVEKNNSNRGWAENFARLFLEAKGDLIFPCDQDDVWDKDKLEKMSRIMDLHKDINLLLGNYRKLIEDDIGNSKLSESNYSHQLKPLPFDEKNIFIDYPGCVFCFRKDWYCTIKDYRFNGYPHDAFLLRMGKLSESAYLLDEPVITWRRHSSNATGTPIRNNADMRIRIEYYIRCLEQMKAYCEDEHLEVAKIDIINRNLEFYHLRANAFKFKKLLGKNGLSQCIRYIDFYPRKRSIFGDAYRIYH